MGRRIAPLIFIFIFTSIAWVILATITNIRTFNQDDKLKRRVGQMWGTINRQNAPNVYYQTQEPQEVERVVNDKTITEMQLQTVKHPVIMDSSDINVELKLDYRKKGLLWYSTYKVKYTSKYVIKNNIPIERYFFFNYAFPSYDGIYDEFCFLIGGEKIEDTEASSGMIQKGLLLKPGESRDIEISYTSQGLNEWWYVFGQNVSQIKNFNLTMLTDFEGIDFPESSISPTKKEKTDEGWKLTWQYSDLISGIQIGIAMPKKINPGPFASRVTFFAPVSLFLFLFLLFIITTIKGINIHPMNYFFISASFFSFHLLLAYLVDHIDVYLAMAICALVSIFLVISYMRFVVGLRFSFLEIGLSQFVYLVLFSYAFFLEGYTGLTITICCIITLFVVMQFTARIDWWKQFGNGNK